MNDLRLTVRENIPVTDLVYRMTLVSDALEEMKPGQFVDIRLDGCYLRRPISVYDSRPAQVTVIYKTVGQGTRQLAGIRPGTELDVLTGLGNGYDPGRAGNAPLLIGGGVGVPPLYLLARKLREQDLPVSVILGFNTRQEVFAESAFRDLGCQTSVTTVDGSYGIRGFVTDALPERYSFFYTCGPMPMLRAVNAATTTQGQFSFETRMGCGFGACMGCTLKTRAGNLRICREGPVFDKAVILWED